MSRPMFKIITSRSTATDVQADGRKVTTITRHLACGHTQLEVSGGKAHLARSAWCKTCEAREEKMPFVTSALTPSSEPS